MKIKISKTWILILPLILSLHLQKVLLFIFVLLSIHESMHILCAHYLGYQTIEVGVYPFGLSARIKDLEYKNSCDEILITLSGLSVHIIMYFFLFFLSDYHIISNSFMLYLNQINMQILCFNLIPIYPLDGGRIIKNILELFFVYQIAQYISLISSCFLLGYYMYIGLLNSLSGILISIFFMGQLIFSFYQYKSKVAQFYLFRYLHGSKGRIKLHRHHDIFKNKTNILIENGKLKSEREFLSRYI